MILIEKRTDVELTINVMKKGEVVKLQSLYPPKATLLSLQIDNYIVT